MSHYRIGHCPQCDDQIMVRSAGGQWNSMKPNYRQVDCVFADGHRMRVPLCAACMAAPDFSTILAAVTCAESEACGASVKQALRRRGLPITARVPERAIQGRPLSAHEAQWRYDQAQKEPPHGR